MRSNLKFLFAAVPAVALASAVAVGASRNGQASAKVDGDLQRDLKLASSTTLELAPVARTLATVSPIEAPPAATPERATRPRRSPTGSRAIRSRAPVVRAAPEVDVAETAEESAVTQTPALGGASTEAEAVAPAAGGVALPRPAPVPVIIAAGGESGPYDPGPGAVIRGGVLDDDHCQIHRRPRTPPIYRQPRGGGIASRIPTTLPGEARPRGSVGGRVGQAAGRSRGGSLSNGSRSSGSTGRGGIAARVASARGGR